MFPYEESLRFCLEESPFSEEFTVRGSGGPMEPVELVTLYGEVIQTLAGDEVAALYGEYGPGFAIRGIFDESAEREEGNRATRVKPRLYLYRWFRRTPPATRVTVRGREYAVTSHERDANLGFVVWLR